MINMEVNEVPDEIIDCLFDVIEKNNKLYVILKEDSKDNEEKRNVERAKTNVEKTKILKNAVSDAFI